MKKILVPVDFSKTSRNAEDYALSLAKILGAEIHLLHVYREIMPATVGPEPWTVTLSEKQVENEKLINREIAYLKTEYGVNVNADVENGSKAKIINSTAKKIQAGLIVMGMRNSRRNRILGSTVLTTIRKSKLPVLIIPEDAKFATIKNIVIAADFTEMLGSTCFDPLFEIYKKFDSSLRVLHVEKPGEELKASEIPQNLQLRLALSRFSYEYEKTKSYVVEEAIQNFIDKHPTDLLVLIAHHHTIYERMFETMHVEAASFKIRLPMLILRNQ